MEKNKREVLDRAPVDIEVWWKRLGCMGNPGAHTGEEAARDAEIKELRAVIGRATADQQAGSVEAERAAFIVRQRQKDNIPDFIADEVIMSGEITQHQWAGWQDRAALDSRAQPVADKPTAEDYEEVLAGHRRLVRKLDVLLNGEGGAAKQASLCDIVAQVKAEGIKSGSAQPVAAGELLDWLETEISAVDTWYRGDPSYERDANWFKNEALRLVTEARKVGQQCADSRPAGGVTLADKQKALDATYPLPTSPHASVHEYAAMKRTAFERGWNECAATLAASVSGNELSAAQPVSGLKEAQDLLPKLESLFNRIKSPSNIRLKCEDDSRVVGDASALCRKIIKAAAYLAAPTVPQEQSAPVPGWISIIDCLPDMNMEVLVWCGYRTLGQRSDDKDDPENHEGWVIDFDNGMASAITHWMPVPAAPAASSTAKD